VVAPTKVDEALFEFATETQAQILRSIQKHGGARPAALADGANHAYYSKTVTILCKKAGIHKPKKIPPRQSDEGKRIMVIPDVQAKPGVDFSYLMREGQYAVEKKPDIIVCGGDFADMPSLSSYDKGKKSFEGRRYKRDIEAAHWAMSAFMRPIVEYNEKHPTRPYKPRMVLCLGNHENRIDRATEDDPKLDGVLSIKDLQYEDFGWEVYPFLEVVMVEGIAFSHYFTTGTMGRPATTAAAILSKKHQSCIAFHQQGLQIATGYRADGALLTSVIAGSNYEHNEDYLGPQGNNHWRGFLMCHDVKDGVFDLMPVSLKFINRRYPHIKAPEPVYSTPTAQEIEAGRM
jgi:hypothetical protein